MARSVVASLFLTCTFLGCSAGRLDEVETNLKREISDLRAIQAQQTASINEIQADVRTLQGKL